MNNFLSNGYKYIALAHRAIWRGYIFAWLALVFWYANLPSLHSPSGPFVYYIFFSGVSLYYIIAEFQHPEPDELGLSAPRVGKYWFAGFAILATIVWAIIHASYGIWNDWPWLILALAATVVAYLLRPRPKKS